MTKESIAHFFNQSLDLNCLANMDGMFVELNERWTTVLGYTIEELKSKPFLEYVHPEDLQPTIDAMSSLGESKEILHFRNRYRKADGTYTWLEWNSYPPDGDTGYIFATARCVDSLIESEQKLARKTAILTTIMKAQDGFIRNGPSLFLWDYVLSSLLNITGSAYGFIGEIGEDSEGRFIQLRALSNRKRNDDIFQQVKEEPWDELIFREDSTLFGRCLRESGAWFINDVNPSSLAHSSALKSLPHSTFASIPVKDDYEVKGIIGLGDRVGGYSDEMIEELAPVLSFLGSIFFSVKLVEDAKETRQDLLKAKSLQDAVLETVESGIVVLESDGTIALINERARQFLRGLHLRRPKTKRSVPEWFEYWFVMDDGQANLIDFLLQTSVRTSPMHSLLSFDNTNENIQHPIHVSAAWLALNADTYPLLLTITDRSRSVELSKREAANALLEQKVHQLRETRRHNEILSECVEFLQACTTQAEGLALISKYLSRFYPNKDDGVVYGMFDADVNTFQLASAEDEIDTTHPMERQSIECWALRSRRVYGYWKGGHRLPCKHTANDTSLEFCVPLFSLERIVAVFTITYKNMTQEEAERRHKAKITEYISLSQSLSGTLSTIALRESLQQLALTDELTKMPNRRSFQDSVRRRIAMARRNKHPFILAMMDIDHFKQINDTFGHDVGDRVLKEMGVMISRFFRTEDLYGRVGGEEFAIFMGQCSGEEAQKRFEVLLQKIPDRIKLPDRDVTVSLGFISSDNHSELEEYNELMLKADQALYYSKQNGRNRWTYYKDIGTETT